MAASKTNRLIHHLRKINLMRAGAELPDWQLLESFFVQRDGAAFAALVKRHGSMVLSVCRRILHNRHDAEDAFQATFLVLLRKAASIAKKELLSNWLYGVAYRTAMKAKTASAKRRVKEAQVENRHDNEPSPENWQALLSLLDQELNRLSDMYRAPIVLCDLEGKTRKEAARLLAVPEGTLSTRLFRGRALLAKKLSRHVPGVTAGTLAVYLSQHAAAASVTKSLADSTVGAAALWIAGKTTAGAIPASIVGLTEGVLKSMLLTRLKIATVAFLAIVFVGSGVGLGSYHLLAAVQPDSQEVADVAKAAKKPDRSDENENLIWERLGLKLRRVGRSEVSQASRELKGGMRVLDVRPDSPAAKQKVRKGDVLVGLHQWETITGNSVSFTLGFCQGAGMKTLSFVLVRNSQIIRGEFGMKFVAAQNAGLRLEQLGVLDAEASRAPQQGKPSAREVNWRNDYNLGRLESQKKNLPLFIYFYADDSTNCEKMETRTLRDPRVIELLNRDFIPMKLEGDHEKNLALELHISAWPTIIVAAPSGKILWKSAGYFEASSLLETLNFVAKGADQTLKNPGAPDLAPLTGQPSAKQVNWRNDYSLARKESQKKNLALFIYLTDKSKLSADIESDTFSDPQVIRLLNRDFIPVKVNAKESFDFSRELRISSFPAIFVVSTDGKNLWRMGGYVQAASLLRQLQDKNLLARKGAFTDYLISASQKITVPFAVNGAGPALKELRFFVSIDEGKTWKIACKASPDERAFLFTAPKDGLYWFFVQAVRSDGQTEPNVVDERVTPALKFLIDADFVADGPGRLECSILEIQRATKADNVKPH